MGHAGQGLLDAFFEVGDLDFTGGFIEFAHYCLDLCGKFCLCGQFCLSPPAQLCSVEELNLNLGLAHLFDIISAQDCIQTRKDKMEQNPTGVSKKTSCNLGSPREEK